MGNVPREVGAIACLKHVTAIRCSHFHCAGEHKEHLFPIMLLTSASWFGAYMKQERLHHAALRREQFEAVVAGFLQRPVPASGRMEDDGEWRSLPRKCHAADCSDSGLEIGQTRGATHLQPWLSRCQNLQDYEQMA